MNFELTILYVSVWPWTQRLAVSSPADNTPWRPIGYARNWTKWRGAGTMPSKKTGFLNIYSKYGWINSLCTRILKL